MDAHQPTVQALREQNEQLRQRNEHLRQQNERLRQQVGQLEADNGRLRAALERTGKELRATQEALAKAQREAARQAAPFRRREQLKKPEGTRRAPGRKPGHAGRYRRPPAEVDEQIEVPLSACPHCKGQLVGVRRVEQIIEELPKVRPRRYRIVTYEGTCPEHGLVRSTHPLQSSRAEGAARTHLGPRAQATAAALVHRTGLSMRNACRVLQECMGLSLTPGGLSQLLGRVAARSGRLYGQIVRRIRHSAAVFADETSWYVGGPGAWLWVFTSRDATLYVVDAGRSSRVVERILGSRYSGILVSDCLASYNPIACRKHKCIAHHLRVLNHHGEALARRGVQSTYLLAWKFHLKDVIATWQRRGELSAAAWQAKLAQLERGVEQLLDRSPAHAEEVAFRDRLRRQRPHLLGCLHDPAAEPTNNRAERDLRPAVISRKISCGNRTARGRWTWQRLRSIAATASKQGWDLIDVVAGYLSLEPRASPVEL